MYCAAIMVVHDVDCLPYGVLLCPRLDVSLALLTDPQLCPRLLQRLHLIMSTGT